MSAPPADAETTRAEAPSKSGVRRIAKRHAAAAHSGMSDAARALDAKYSTDKREPMRLW
jgi:hypothetical protein